MKYALTLILTTYLFTLAKSPVERLAYAEQWVCSPCGYDCDKTVYNAPGTCPHCGMPLVKKSTVVFGNVAPENLAGYLRSHPGAILLDVRTKEEFEGTANPDFGTLKNAINIPVQELDEKLSRISNLKKKQIVVYCSHGHRSEQASYILTQNGFASVTNMTGGMSVMHDQTLMVKTR
jgi:rhodanese-related sulfurtransferase